MTSYKLTPISYSKLIDFESHKLQVDYNRYEENNQAKVEPGKQSQIEGTQRSGLDEESDKKQSNGFSTTLNEFLAKEFSPTEGFLKFSEILNLVGGDVASALETTYYIRTAIQIERARSMFPILTKGLIIEPFFSSITIEQEDITDFFIGDAKYCLFHCENCSINQNSLNISFDLRILNKDKRAFLILKRKNREIFNICKIRVIERAIALSEGAPII